MARKDCVRCSCIEEKQKKLVDALMSAQQCVRFVELDRSGRTRTDGELQAFARADVGDEWVYEVQCEVAEDGGNDGMAVYASHDHSKARVIICRILQPS